MSIVKPVEEHDATPDVQETYEQIKKRYGGFPPDLYKAIANDPAYLDSIVDQRRQGDDPAQDRREDGHPGPSADRLGAGREYDPAAQGSLSAQPSAKGAAMQVRRLGVGIVAGVVGGVVFGAMMHMMGMIGMIAGLVGQEGAAVGWLVHLVNSAAIGAIYGATFGQLPHSWARGAGFGLGYGAIWWILGALLIMPLWMGMPTFQVGETQIWSLVGHLMYGLVTGLVFTAAVGQTAGQPAHTH